MSTLSTFLTTAETQLTIPRLSKKSLTTRIFIAAAAVLVLVWSYHGSEIRPLELFTNRLNMWEYAKGFGRPDFAYWREIFREMIVTVQIAVWGTFLAIVMA
ncbi:MAG: hypothetical protein MI702_04635, partial [Chlorobiales bacterium]|nr:hypothetical protein [Chlorobiales bacterium]